MIGLARINGARVTSYASYFHISQVDKLLSFGTPELRHSRKQFSRQLHYFQNYKFPY
jgi:hypothetical protein